MNLKMNSIVNAIRFLLSSSSRCADIRALISF